MVDVGCCHDRGSFARAFFITGSQGAEGAGGGRPVSKPSAWGHDSNDATKHRSSEAANAKEREHSWEPREKQRTRPHEAKARAR